MNVLLVGESWMSEATHYKGFDSFTSVTFHTGGDWYIDALMDSGIRVTQMMAHEVLASFPFNADDLDVYDVVVLSDIGANSFLLPPETWLQGQTKPNRLQVIADWVRGGGGLLMAGGYLSFSGFEAKAHFHGTPVEDVLPVTIATFDDRVEAPQGAQPQVTAAAHDVVRGLQAPWPGLLGYNRVHLKDGAELVATVDGDVLIATQEVGDGRTAVWTSDIGPHWCPEPFVQWDGFPILMGNLVRWLAKR
jgi:uncharacterized membrane protein